MTYLRPSSDHIPLHRLWMFSTLQVDMIMPDHAHLLDCEECRTGLRVCLKAGSFASVLKQLKPVDYAEHQATSTLQISQEETDDEVVAAIVSLFTVAVRGGGLAGSSEREPSLGLRIRATRALALFLPHHEARTGLIALMTSDDIPAEIQEVAAEGFREQQ